MMPTPTAETHAPMRDVATTIAIVHFLESCPGLWPNWPTHEGLSALPSS